MKKILNIILLSKLMMLSLFAHGQPDNVLGMSTIVTLAPTVYISDASSDSNAYRGTKELQAQKFIEENREAIEVEVAQGDGEKIDTLATLYDIKERDKWKSNLQKNYEKVFYKKTNEPKSSIEVSGEMVLFFEKSFK